MSLQEGNGVWVARKWRNSVLNLSHKCHVISHSVYNEFFEVVHPFTIQDTKPIPFHVVPLPTRMFWLGRIVGTCHAIFESHNLSFVTLYPTLIGFPIVISEDGNGEVRSSCAAPVIGQGFQLLFHSSPFTQPPYRFNIGNAGITAPVPAESHLVASVVRSASEEFSRVHRPDSSVPTLFDLVRRYFLTHLPDPNAKHLSHVAYYIRRMELGTVCNGLSWWGGLQRAWSRA